MHELSNRREFLRAATAASTGLLVSSSLFGAKRKSVLLFTKSSGWEHDVVKNTGGNASIVERAIRALGVNHGFDVTATKDGRIFDSSGWRGYDAVFFFTSGDLLQSATDGNSPMTPQGKQALLDAVQHGLGFAGVHSASDTFYTLPDPPDKSNRYSAHGEQSDPYLRMLGGEFIIHGQDPRLQTAKVIVSDPNFPGLQGVASPVSFNEEWYPLKDYSPDLHVILTLDTRDLKGECYQRAPYPVTWARQLGQGRVFYAAMGDRPENWENTFFLNLLAGGIRWAIGDSSAPIFPNLQLASPGYAEIPPKSPPEK